jgi:hypothetical protein
VNYTREPIIESVISPKEGCKLAIRNSKNIGEEYFVDAIEIVSFSNAVFYRSKERPKEFLVPVSDYEIIEVKETKMVLKNATLDRSIKISSSTSSSASDSSAAGPSSSFGSDLSAGPSLVNEEDKQSKKKKNIKRTDRKTEPPKAEIEKLAKGGDKDEETIVSSSTIRKIFPPPSTLIKEKLNHYKGDEKDVKFISQEIVSQKEDKKIEKSEIEENLIELEREKIKKELIDKISEEIKSSEENF